MTKATMSDQRVSYTIFGFRESKGKYYAAIVRKSGAMIGSDAIEIPCPKSLHRPSLKKQDDWAQAQAIRLRLKDALE
jgi:hypothetical protein